MPTPSRDKLLRMDGWPGGINNRIRETEQKVERQSETIRSSEYLRKALNVDLTAEGHPLRRRGRNLLAAGNTHSLWANDSLGLICCVADGTLYASTDSDYAAQAFAAISVNKYLPVSYCVMNGSVFWSNGASLGEIDVAARIAKPWGTPVAPQPIISVGPVQNAGGWEDARQVAVVYVDDYGTEGGASEPVLATGQGAFTVTIPMPLPAGVSKANIYVSEAGGEILYLTESLISSSVATIYDVNVGRGKEIDTLNLKPPKAGQLVAANSGRIYIARNNQIFFTEALRYHLTRPAQGIYMFPETITMLEPAANGLYVGTKNGVAFIAGTDPYDVKQDYVSRYAPVEGAITRIGGNRLGVPVDDVPVWWNIDGVLMVGLPNGEVKELTRDRFAVPEYAAGAISLSEREGMSHLVSSLRSSDGINKMGATDSVVASVRTNNIVINS